MTRDTPVRPILLAALCCAVVCSVAFAPAAAAAVTPASTATASSDITPSTTATVSSAAATATSDSATDRNATLEVDSDADATPDAEARNETSTGQIDDSDEDAGPAEQVGGWSEATYEDPAGDVVTLTLDLSAATEGDDADATDATTGPAGTPDHAYVQIGSADAGFIDVLYLADANDDGEITLSINTRTLGTSDSISATNTDLVYHAPDDEVRSAVHGRLPRDEHAPTFVGADGEELSSFDAYLAELGLIGSADTERGIDQLDRPLQPGTYSVAAGTGGEFRVLESGSTAPGETAPGLSAMAAGTDADAAGDGSTDAAAQTSTDAAADPATLGRATVELTRPGIDDVTVHTAPAAEANAAANHTALETAMTERDTVAAGDRLVIAAEATGIYGHLVAIEGDFESLETGFAPSTLVELETRTGEGVRFAVEAREGPVVQGPGSSAGIDSPTEVLGLSGVDPETVALYTDEESGELFVVVDTRDLRAFDPDAVDGERNFAATMTYETDDEEPFLFDRADRHIQTFDRGLLGGAGGDPGQPAFPYLDPGANVSDTTDFATASRFVRFEGTERANDGGTSSTNGETPRIRLLADDSVRIAGETNLAPGTEATLRVASRETAGLSYIQLSSTTVDRDGTFAGTFDLSDASVGDTARVTFEREEDTPLATATIEIVGSETPMDAEPEPLSPYDGSMTTDGTGLTDGETPGFGFIVAIVALIAATFAVMIGTARSGE
ncbi:cell surface protein [haloarchaeon 3A1-DGR]|nr:cell surface protein [haloarchaeon 3A1-DGR]